MSKALKTIYFEDVEDLSSEIMDKLYSSEDDYSICVIGKFKEIERLIRNAFENDDIYIENLSISDPKFSGYNNEYYLHFILMDGEIGICCEVARDEDRIINNSCDETYILSDCGSRVIKHCDTDEKYLVIIGESECDDYESCNCCISECNFNNTKIIRDGLGNIHGFRISKNDDNSHKSVGYFTTDELTTDDVIEILKNYSI